MVQDAVVTRLISNGMAEVTVKRASACGKNCSSCEGCALQSEFKVLAHNPIGAKPGAKVSIQSSSGKVFGAVFLVYLLPIFSLVLAYILAAKLGFGEGACIGFGFLGLFIAVACMLLVNKCFKNKTAIEYTITKELS